LQQEYFDATEQFKRTPIADSHERRRSLQLMSRILGQLDAVTSQMRLEADEQMKRPRRDSDG
jgi:hypothetical protein